MGKKIEIKLMKEIEKWNEGATFCVSIKNEHWYDLVEMISRNNKKLFETHSTFGTTSNGYVGENRKVVYTVEGYHAMFGWDDMAQMYFKEMLEDNQ